MALTDEGNNGMIMPVQPMYGGGYPIMNGGNGFGMGMNGDWSWILLLLLICGGGWGGLGGFGMGGMMWPMMMGMGGGIGIDYLYPWLNNSQHISDGFRDQQLNTTVQGVHNAVTSGFGDVQLGIAGINQNISTTGAGIQQTMCQGFNSVNQNISGTAAQAEISANGRHNALTGQLYNNEIANLNRSFAEQTANQQGFNSVQGQLAKCCCDNQLATVQTQNVVQSEAAATRAANAANTQAILDKLCQLELDNYKAQLAQAQRENVALQNAVNMSAMRESQTEQTARILAGQAAEIDGVYNRLKNCPVGTVPVFGNQPIFTCPTNVGNNGCGCGCGG